MDSSSNSNSSTAHALYIALEDQLKAEISAARATMLIYFKNNVGIGEHPQHLDEMQSLLEKMTNANDKLSTLRREFQSFSDSS